MLKKIITIIIFFTIIIIGLSAMYYFLVYRPTLESPDRELRKNNPAVSDFKDDKTLAIKKTIYSKGEKIEALFSFREEIYIGDFYKLYRFENSDWKYLGEWNFGGNPHTCCGWKSNPPKYDSFISSPLQISWDQKIPKESYVPIGEEVIKKQAPFGKYKMKVSFGNHPICPESVEVEFTIK